MKDSNKTIRTAYYNALNNIVTFNSAGIPFYDAVPSNAAYPYIYVSDYTAAEDTTKDFFGQNVTITLIAAMKYPANYGGQSDIDSLAGQISAIVRGTLTTDQPLSFLPDFQNVITQLDQSNFFRQEVTDGIVFYRSLKFRHRIQQLT
ncbi:MAG: hypothetical protein ACLQQ4_09570 [Bacteroidia bacterium]